MNEIIVSSGTGLVSTRCTEALNNQLLQEYQSVQHHSRLVQKQIFLVVKQILNYVFFLVIIKL